MSQDVSRTRASSASNLTAEQLNGMFCASSIFHGDACDVIFAYLAGDIISQPLLQEIGKLKMSDAETEKYPRAARCKAAAEAALKQCTNKFFFSSFLFPHATVLNDGRHFVIASREARTNDHVLVRVNLATGQSGVFAKLPNEYRTPLDTYLHRTHSQSLHLHVAEQSGTLFVANMEGHISRFSSTGQRIGQLLDITDEIPAPDQGTATTYMEIAPYPKGDRCAVWVNDSGDVQVWDCDKRSPLFRTTVQQARVRLPVLPVLHVDVLPRCNGLMFRSGGKDLWTWEGQGSTTNKISAVGSVCFPFPDDSIVTFAIAHNGAGQPLAPRKFELQRYNIQGKLIQPSSYPQSLLNSVSLMGAPDERQCLLGQECGATSRYVLRDLKTGRDFPVFSPSGNAYAHRMFPQHGHLCEAYTQQGRAARLDFTYFGNQHGKAFDQHGKAFNQPEKAFDLELQEDGTFKTTERKQ